MQLTRPKWRRPSYSPTDPALARGWRPPLWACLVIGLMAVAGCAQNPATGKNDFTAFMSEEEEIEAGKTQHPKFVDAYGGLYPDEALNAYVQSVGQALVAQSERADLTFHFTILNASIANAFALPGGYVYITRGLMVLLSDEAELAGVLAHELAHVTARHAAREHSRRAATGLGLMMLSVVTGGLSTLMEPTSEVLMMSYNRDEETEADRLALRYLERAGYDIHGVPDFLGKLESFNRLMSGHGPKEKGLIDSWMATHPPMEDRIRWLNEMLEGRPAEGLRRRELFLRRIEGLPFMVNPMRGIIGVRLTQVAEGETAAFLAQRMPIANQREQWFAVLNGLTEGQNPKPGQLVKLLGYEDQ